MKTLGRCPACMKPTRTIVILPQRQGAALSYFHRGARGQACEVNLSPSEWTELRKIIERVVDE